MTKIGRGESLFEGQGFNVSLLQFSFINIRDDHTFVNEVFTLPRRHTASESFSHFVGSSHVWVV